VLKIKEEITNPFAPISLIDDDSRIVFESSNLFASHIRREVLDLFIFFKKNIKNKICNLKKKC
jgi:hypothetical protein